MTIKLKQDTETKRNKFAKDEEFEVIEVYSNHYEAKNSNGRITINKSKVEVVK